MKIQIKRVYEEANESDGIRILVDRLWPRGLTRQRAKADLWLKDIAPSIELRKWFAHDPEKWTEFQKRYQAELRESELALLLLREQCAKGRVHYYTGQKTKNATMRLS